MQSGSPKGSCSDEEELDYHDCGSGRGRRESSQALWFNGFYRE